MARFTQGQDVDESLALLRGTTTDYYDADGLGSTTSLTDSNGSVAQSYTYDSFGNTTNSTGSLTNTFRYAAREFDSETNLYEYRVRYYDPTVGRFLSEDPLEFDGGMNFYGYTANDPVGLIDPSGMVPDPADANGFWIANLNDPELSPIAHSPWPSSGRFFGIGQGPSGGQQCVALTRHFTGLPCTDCWRAGPKVIGNTIPAGTAIATFDENGRYPQTGEHENSGIYVSTYPGNRIVIIDQWPATPTRPARPAGARTLRPVGGAASDNSGGYSVITVPHGTQSSRCKCGNW